MSYDYAIHSDYLVHWTGKDIDTQHAPDWPTLDKSTTDSEAEEKDISSAFKIFWITAYG